MTADNPRHLATARWPIRLLIGAMTFLQIAWHAAMWVTGSAATEKLPLLMAYSLLLGAVALFAGESLRSRAGVWQTALWEQPRRWLWGLCIGVGAVGLIYAAYQRVWVYDEAGAYRAA